MKLNRLSVAAASTLLSEVLTSMAQAHPGHGESGWVHPHSAVTGMLLAIAYVGGFAAFMLLLHAVSERASATSQAALRLIRSKNPRNS